MNNPNDSDNPSADALDLLWNDVILAKSPLYGDWEYPMQAYRHIMEEHRDQVKMVKTLTEENRELKKRIEELNRKGAP